jgi:hypothetical protein
MNKTEVSFRIPWIELSEEVARSIELGQTFSLTGRLRVVEITRSSTAPQLRVTLQLEDHAMERNP